MSRTWNGCRVSGGAARSGSLKRCALRAILSSAASASAIDEVLADAPEQLVVDLLVVHGRDVQLDPDRDVQRVARGNGRRHNNRGHRRLLRRALTWTSRSRRRALAAVAGRHGRLAVPCKSCESQERNGLLLAHSGACLVGLPEESDQSVLSDRPRVLAECLEQIAVGPAHHRAKGLAELCVSGQNEGLPRLRILVPLFAEEPHESERLENGALVALS